MRKINVRSPFYISGEDGIEPVIVPVSYFYHTATECGGATTVSVRSTTELTNGQGIKVNGYGDTCFEVTGVLTETNETDVTFIYDTCDKCNGVIDYNYYSAELCSGGSPINVRSVDTLTVGQVIKAQNYSADCYTITGSGSSNTNTVVTLFNSCDHCETGIDYKYYDANSCDGTSSVVVRYEGTLPASLPVINVSGQGDKCFVLDGLTDETSTNDITSFYQSCISCTPTDPYTYYTATECGGSATVDFKSNITLAIGSSVTLDGYGTTCYQVTSVGSVSGIAWTNKYADCTACANANDPYNYFYAQKCDGTGTVIKIASTNTLDYMLPRLWKASGQDDTCFSILSQTTSGGTVYNAIATCPECPSDDPFTYWKAIKCSGSTIVYFRSLVDMTGKVVKFSGDNNCYQVTNKVSTPNTKDWSKIFTDCTTCEEDGILANLKDVNLLTAYKSESLTGKTVSQLENDYKCLACQDTVQYDTHKALIVPMAVGHQLYNADGTKNTTLTGHFASISTELSPTASVCNKGQIVFPLIYSFNNGVVTYVKAGSVNECYSLPTSPESVALNCGSTHIQGADAGRKLYTVYSSGVGNFTITVSGDEVPCKFVLKWNGQDQVDTGYIGSNEYDAQLLAAGVQGNEINTGTTSTKSATLSFNKTSSSPNLIQLEVFSPLVNDEYTINVTECPPLPAPNFATGLYVGIGGNCRLGYESREKFPVNNTKTEIEKCFNNPGSVVNTNVFYTTSAMRNESWIQNFGFGYSDYSFRNYYLGYIFNLFIDTNGDYGTHKGFDINVLNSTNFKWDIEDFKQAMTQLDITKVFYIIYVVDPYPTSTDAILNHTVLLEILDFLKTDGGEYGLKELYDLGRLKIVYNVERRDNGYGTLVDPEYYASLVAEQINNLNSGITLTCG
jgi:hypothetical protein